MTDTNIKLQPLVPRYRQSFFDLLVAERLPVKDLPEHPENFFVAITEERVVGGIGLEQHGSFGLLRSLVVDPAWRSQQIAGALLQQLEQRAVALGLEALFLLTETAPHYFEKKGFGHVARAEVPDAIRRSSEFSNVCPQSAAVMKKNLN